MKHSDFLAGFKLYINVYRPCWYRLWPLENLYLRWTSAGIQPHVGGPDLAKCVHWPLISIEIRNPSQQRQEFSSSIPSKHCSGIMLLNFCVPMGAEKSNMALWHCKTFKCWWRSNKLLPKYSRLVLSIKTAANRPILQKKLQKKKSLDHFWSFSGRSAFRRFPVLERIFRLEWFPAEQQLLRLSF